ncbi:MAG: hypothetical protein BV459_01540 [Thermoplasmata archaeon M11B2D]|nr:MAG: hypothetical protein BV459_01540 [Thermoplasmata archaeon M11B2D]
MTVIEIPEEKTVKIKCDNCGEVFKTSKPVFKTEYELQVWTDQTRLCNECIQLNVEPHRIKIMVNQNPTGKNWNASMHGEHYLSSIADEEELKLLVEKEKEIRKANTELQKKRIDEEFKGKLFWKDK